MASSARPGRLRRVANLRALVDLPGMLGGLQGAGPPLARLDAGPYPLAYLRRPETVRALLDGRLEGVAERGRFFREVSRVIGPDSLVTCEGEQHRRLRRLLAVAFRPEQLGAYGETMLAAAEELGDGWQDGQELLLGRAMSRLTLEIAARSLLGLERAEQLDAFTEVLAAGSRVFYRLVLPRWLGDPLWRSRLSPANRRLFAAQARVDRFVAALLAERRARPSSVGEGRPANLLDVLLAAASKEGGLSDGELRDQIVTFLFAGHETTAQALTWTFVAVSRQPEVEARLLEEQAAVLGGRAPTVADLPSLVYARAVVRESLRLFPPAWFLSREASQAATLEGCPVPAGTLLLASPLALHRDERNFADPLRFYPDRWLVDQGDQAPPAYLPFGHGRRNCIGANFALTELVLVLSSLSRRWRLVVRDPERVRERPTVTLRPRSPVWVLLKRRDGTRSPAGRDQPV